MKNKKLTPERAQKLQNEIFYKMTPEKKIRITSQFFMLGKKLHESGIKYLKDNKDIR